MGLFDRPARVRIQRIADAEDTTASRVHRAALQYGLPELCKALQHGRSSRVPAVDGERPEVEAAVP